jgi:hypothetical protein
MLTGTPGSGIPATFLADVGYSLCLCASSLVLQAGGEIFFVARNALLFNGRITISSRLRVKIRN